MTNYHASFPRVKVQLARGEQMAVEHVDLSMSRLDRAKEATALKKREGKTQGECAGTRP